MAVDLEEGVLKLTLTIAQLDGGVPVISEHINLQSLPWRMMLVASQDVIRNSQGGKGRTVGVFIQCVPDSPRSQNWSAEAHIELKVHNHINTEKNFLKVFDHNYSNSSTDWGYSSFMKWKDFTDASRGFVKDDNIFIEAKLTIKGKREASFQPAMGIGAVDTFLVCPGCSENFEAKGDRMPMSLRCGHTFCSVCLKKASCKSEDNITLKCSSCNQVHTSINETELCFPNHSMVQIIVNMISKSKTFCQIHQHDKNYYCFDDNALVCIYCAYHGEHSAHTCKLVEEARKEVEVSLKKIKLSMSSHVSQMERKLQFFKDEEDILKTQENNICRVIEDTYGQLQAVLLKQKELLFRELKSRGSEISSSIDTNLKFLEKKHSQMKAVLNEYTTWKTLPARDALELYTGVQSRLSSIASLCAEANLPQQSELCPKLSFEMNSLSETLCFGKLGRIVFEGRCVKGAAGTSESSETDTHEHLEDVPPNKKRKKSLSNLVK